MTNSTLSQTPAGWKRTTLGEVADITSAKRIFANEYKDSGIPFFRGKEITEKFNGNEISTELFISRAKYDEIKNSHGVPVVDDILLTSVGTLGNPYLVEKGLEFYFKDGNLTWFRKYMGIVPKYLYYWIISPQGKETLSQAKIGSTQEAYTIAKLKSLNCVLPSITEQISIAKILSSIDDKVELLRKQNKTLETLAQTIFKEWFVSFNFPGAIGKMINSELGPIPEGWRVGKLGDILKLEYGKPMKNEDRSGSGYPVYGSNGVVGYHHNFLIKGDGIVVGRKGTMGSVTWVESNFYPIDTTFYVQDKMQVDRLYFHYLLLQRQELKKIGSDSAVPGLNRNSAYSIKTIIPETESIVFFCQVVEPAFSKMKNNSLLIKTLVSVRNNLLPKLMNGEIRVEPTRNGNGQDKIIH